MYSYLYLFYHEIIDADNNSDYTLYDSSDRQIAIYDDITTYTYDIQGRLITEHTDLGSRTFSYDTEVILPIAFG